MIITIHLCMVSVVLYNSFLPGFTQESMAGVTYETGNAYSSRASHSTFQWMIHVVSVLFPDFCQCLDSFSGQRFWFCLL